MAISVKRHVIMLSATCCMLGYEGRYRVIVSDPSLTISAKPILSHHSLGSLRIYSLVPQAATS